MDGRRIHIEIRVQTQWSCNFQKDIVLCSLKIDYVLENSADPDEMPLSAYKGLNH